MKSLCFGNCVKPTFRALVVGTTIAFSSLLSKPANAIDPAWAILAIPGAYCAYAYFSTQYHVKKYLTPTGDNQGCDKNVSGEKTSYHPNVQNENLVPFMNSGDSTPIPLEKGKSNNTDLAI